MKYDLVIFDLDGTLLNTLGDLTSACNHAMRVHGFPEHTAEEVRTFIGSGVARLIDRAVPENTPAEVRARALCDFRAYYAEHVRDLTAPYPGVLALLRRMKSAGMRIAVNTNKPNEAANALCRAYFSDLVEQTLGEREGIARKPAPDAVDELMRSFGTNSSRTLYVGDSDIDLFTAHNANVDAAWVSWGFRRRNELGDVFIDRAFDSVSALEAFLFDE